MRSSRWGVNCCMLLRKKNNSIIKNHIKTEIVENELKIICDDKTTIYKLSIRS